MAATPAAFRVKPAAAGSGSVGEVDELEVNGGPGQDQAGDAVDAGGGVGDEQAHAPAALPGQIAAAPPAPPPPPATASAESTSRTPGPMAAAIAARSTG